MLLNDAIWLGTSSEGAVSLLPAMANRHGLISGATGTGKTVTLQVLAEGFSQLGVPVFLADVKGDLAGLCKPGEGSAKIDERLEACGAHGFPFRNSPVTFWDVFGKKGHPIRTTVSEMGPLLLARMLGLNDTQAGVLHLVFRIADDQGMLLIDLKDVRAMLSYVGEDTGRYTLDYGNITKASIGAIQRAIAILEDQGGSSFFGEPALDMRDWLSRDESGQGMVNILHAEELFRKPTLYSTFLLWMLGELYELLPEQGDKELPRMVFFFDEAHLLFDDCPKTLLERIEQTVRLIRSKGVGVYFITQIPTDIPSSVLSQLSGRVQHALRAFTPAEQKVVRAVAQTFRANPAFDTEEAISGLKTGEALLSFLQEDGTPSVVQKATILPPQSYIGAISDDLRAVIMDTDPVSSKYDDAFDRESAYEVLAARMQAQQQPMQQSRVVQPIPQAIPAQPAAPAQPAYAPVSFRVFNPVTGEYEEQQLAAMPAFQPAPQTAYPAQPVSYPMQPIPEQDTSLTGKIKQAAASLTSKEKKPAKKRSEMSYGQQLWDNVAKSATTSAGRQLGSTLTRSLLGVLGLDGKKKR